MPLRELVLVRHAESVGNVARERAEGSGADVVDIDVRDPDVGLSELGIAQAGALGQALADLPAASRPTAAWTSPYVRAADTLRRALEHSGIALPVTVDERLRDRELGVLDRLTGAGVRNRFPEEAARRRYLGKMYYRPPGGESWADVAFRVRSVLRDMEDRCGRGEHRLLVTTHDAVIMLFRYVLEPLDERAVLELAASASVHNTSITRLVPGEAGWRVAAADVHDHLARAGVEATEHGTAAPSGPVRQEATRG